MNQSTSSKNNDVPRVLVVDDEKVIREILADFLSLEGFYVMTAADGSHAIQHLQNAHFDMVISDLKMPNMGGLELLEVIQSNHENVLTVIMTGFGTVETAIEAMKKGAYDYILKPFKVEEVVHIVHRGLEKQRLISENIRLREIISLHELSESLQATLSLEEIIDSTLHAGIKNIGCDLASYYLRNEELGHFEVAGTMVHADAPPGTAPGSLNLDKIIETLITKRTILAHGSEALSYYLVPPKDLASFMCIPLIARENIIGMIVFQTSFEESRFKEGQRKLVSMLGSRAAAAVDNAVLFRNLQQTFRQTILSLARALEAMDKYTAGHSDRVTVYARITAEAFGETPEQVELITQAAILHDIGKLGCHANLNKPEKLTEEEYEIFKSHPAYGKEIIEPIAFLRPLIPGIHLHHERWDGKGYPLGLAGTDIPLMARILAVADSYDAMTSNRAYRRALKHDVAIMELKRCSGSQFDPVVIDAFLLAINNYRNSCRDSNVPIPE